MKPLTLFLSALVAFPLALTAATPKQQVAQAKKTAGLEKKDLLLIFSGTEWQKESQDFERTILKAELFQKESGKDFVQVLMECPRSRAEAHTDLLELQQTYRFRNLPAVILADQGGRPYAYVGAGIEEPEAYLKSLAEFRNVRVERDRLFNEAFKAKGVERAKLLIKALKTMPQDMVRDFYSPELVAIADADKKGKTSYVGEIEKADALRQEKERFGMFFRNKQYDEAIKSAKAEGAKLKGEDAQRVKLYEIQALAAKKLFAEAAKEVGVMTEMAPDSEIGKRSEGYLTSLKSAEAREAKMKEVAKQPIKANSPMVSKPVAIVNDINELKKDAKAAEEAAAKAMATEKKLKEANAEIAQKIASLSAELKALQVSNKEDAAALKKAGVEREQLVRRSIALKEVVESHEAMEKRKRSISDLEKRASELQEEAKELRKKAAAIKKGR